MTGEPKVTIRVPKFAGVYPADLTTAEILRTAAGNLRAGRPLGGANATMTVAVILDRIAIELTAGPTCPECGRTDVTLTQAGRMRHHSGNEYVFGSRRRCAGARKPPADTPEVTQ